MKNQTVAVYGDLTALYYARAEYGKTINYEALDRILKATAGFDPTGRFNHTSFYTLFSDQNDKQVNFVKTLDELGWKVHTVHPRQVCRGRPTDHRFNANIGFDIGLGVGEYDKIIVVSDSWDLSGPIDRLIAEEDCQVSLVFFSEALDSRWWPKIRNQDSKINFVDLDVELYQ